MSSDEFIVEMQLHAKRLNDLMQDPHPGLSTWTAMLGEEVQWWSDYWSGKFSNEQLDAQKEAK